MEDSITIPLPRIQVPYLILAVLVGLYTSGQPSSWDLSMWRLLVGLNVLITVVDNPIRIFNMLVGYISCRDRDIYYVNATRVLPQTQAHGDFSLYTEYTPGLLFTGLIRCYTMYLGSSKVIK
jgi:hypothetical protein